jgi:hypothetical protein
VRVVWGIIGSNVVWGSSFSTENFLIFLYFPSVDTILLGNESFSQWIQLSSVGVCISNCEECQKILFDFYEKNIRKFIFIFYLKIFTQWLNFILPFQASVCVFLYFMRPFLSLSKLPSTARREKRTQRMNERKFPFLFYAIR